MYYLAINPDKQEKLRQEINRLLPNKDSPITLETINNIPYLRACMKESARMMPVLAGSARMVNQDIVISGYRIPKGTNVAMGNGIIQNDEKYFEKADKFLPERWIRNEKGEVGAKSTHPFVYMPFGFGPRTCVGRRFADLEMEILLMR